MIPLYCCIKKKKNRANKPNEVTSNQGGDETRREEPYLEADVDVGSVDGGGPPQGEAAVGDLVETRPLRVRELLVLHRLLESACLESGGGGPRNTRASTADTATTAYENSAAQDKMRLAI